MNQMRFLLAIVILGASNPQLAHASAGSQDDLLRDVHAALRITGAHVEWVPNPAGGNTPTLVYDITNATDWNIPVPVTVIGRSAANWAGSRQHWIERLGADPSISAMPRGIAKRANNRQYAYGGIAIAWPGQSIPPRGFVRFAQPIQIGGFPSGRYAIYVEYSTTHDLKLIQSQVLYFDVP